MDNNVHKEHRKRVRNEFLSNGFNDATPPHKVLEMLLFYSIPRVDTNETAHRLLKHFGSFDKVIDAPVEELKRVEGVGENTAVLLKLMAPVIRLYIKEKTDKTKIGFKNSDELESYIFNKYIGLTKETFAVTTFDGKGRFIGFDVLADGDLNTVVVSTRDVVETVIKRNAAFAVISHNHPGGDAIPSIDDIKTTENLFKALKNINVALIDHIVICDDDYVSLRVSKDYKHLFQNPIEV